MRRRVAAAQIGQAEAWNRGCVSSVRADVGEDDTRCV